jgi:hypothetical protein
VTADNPLKCPPFDFLSPEQEALENVDTLDEKNFGEIKRKERTAILASDMAPVVTGPKRTNKKGKCFQFCVLTERLPGSHVERVAITGCVQAHASRAVFLYDIEFV